MIVVEDSMVLIFLAKLDLIEEVKQMFGRVLISKEVEKETVIEAKAHPDALKIEGSIRRGLIEVKDIKDKKRVSNLMKIFGLGLGEASTIQLYLQEKADLLLCDEKKARNVANILGLDMVGTPEVILELYKNKFISKEKAKDSVIGLEKIGWFNPSIIFKALSEIGD